MRVYNLFGGAFCEHICWIVSRSDFDNFQTLFLQESYVEIVYPIFETKLGLIIRTKTLSHLRGFSCVVVKVNSTERNERSVGVLTDFSNAMSLHDNILEELRIFNLEIKRRLG